MSKKWIEINGQYLWLEWGLRDNETAGALVGNNLNE